MHYPNPKPYQGYHSGFIPVKSQSNWGKVDRWLTFVVQVNAFSNTEPFLRQVPRDNPSVIQLDLPVGSLDFIG